MYYYYYYYYYCEGEVREGYNLCGKFVTVSIFDIDIFVNCSWVDTDGRSTVHIYTQTIHRTTQFYRIDDGLEFI